MSLLSTLVAAAVSTAAGNNYNQQWKDRVTADILAQGLVFLASDNSLACKASSVAALKVACPGIAIPPCTISSANNTLLGQLKALRDAGVISNIRFHDTETDVVISGI